MNSTNHDMEMVERNTNLSGTGNDPMMIYDTCFKMESFFQLYENRLWFKIDDVRIQYVWKDMKENTLFLFLLNKHRHIIPAIVPESLLPCFEGRKLVGRLISMIFFQAVSKDAYDYPRYENFTLEISNYVIVINSKTEVTDITNDDYDDDFPKYPIMPNIKILAEDKTPRRIMTDIIGKVSKGYLGYPQARISCTLFLRDWSGSEVKVVLLHNLNFSVLAKAIDEQGILYVSRVKLIHPETHNYLESTPLTVIQCNPDTYETTYIGRLPIPIFTQGETQMTDEFNPEMLGINLECLQI